MCTRPSRSVGAVQHSNKGKAASMFLQSVFSRNKSGACDGALALDATPFVDTEALVLSVSKELISDVESYFWNQVGMFGGTVFRWLIALYLLYITYTS